MGFNDFLNRAASVARGALFEDEVSESTESTESSVSAEQFEGCEAEGSMAETAQNMLKKAVEELDQKNPEDNISKVQDCIAILGEECPPELVRKTIQTLAKCDPDTLKEDGEARVAKITALIALVAKKMDETLEEVATRNEQIAEEEATEEASYDDDVQTLTKKCEDDIKALRENLQKDIEARATQRDERFEQLKKRRAENAQIKAEAEELNREVNMRGSTLISQIKKWLSKL